MVIGITGGIGSGKSLVTKLLQAKFGAAVIDTDTVGHEVMEIGTKAYYEIVDVFGKEVPAVEAEVDKRIEDFIKKNYKYIALETALLIKVGYNRKCDKVWYVYADKDVRLKRLYYNRGLDRVKTAKIIDNQNSDEEYRKVADEVIDNSGTEEETLAQIKNILECC